MVELYWIITGTIAFLFAAIIFFTVTFDDNPAVVLTMIVLILLSPIWPLVLLALIFMAVRALTRPRVDNPAHTR